MGMKSGGGGEIVQVQGGHIVRSTGRKDRHSKVYTAKGPRDRRVRLSAHTAIQFYDVQDRLGYDRPSKAVDWLIKKAKSSIDKLAELPPWQPPVAVEANEMAGVGGGAVETQPSAGYNFHQLHQNQTDSSNFNIITDTMKSFFPTSSAAADNSSINFQNYPPHDDHNLISNPTTTATQDLGLSLHSFQDQGLNIHHQAHQSQQIPTLFGSAVGFDSSSYQRMVAWNNDNRGGGGGGGGGFLFNSQPHHDHESFGQGGTLQSSFAPSVSSRGWNDHLQMASQRSQQQQQQPMLHHDQSSSIFGTRFGGSDGSGLPVFGLPGARMQGQEAENGLVSARPSSTSPNSTHH